MQNPTGEENLVSPHKTRSQSEVPLPDIAAKKEEKKKKAGAAVPRKMKEGEGKFH